MKVQITVTEDFGWVAFTESGAVVGSDDTLSSLKDTVGIMGWIVVRHTSGIPDWK